MKKRNVGIVALLLCVFLVGCQAGLEEIDTSNKPIRLASDFNGDWGVEAIKLNSYEKKESIKIAVLDSGTNITSAQIVGCYSTIKDSAATNDTINHGTIVIGKLIQLNPNAEIISIKVFDNNDYIDQIALKEGVEMAIANKVDVINISIGTTEYSSEVEASIKEAIKSGIVVVAAAGNQGNTSLLYPAAYDGVVSVISRDINNKDSKLNNVSKNKKSFSAPGDHILIKNDDFVSGNSIACAFVSATISLIKNENKELSVQQITELLINTAIYPSEDSYGLIQCEDAINAMK